MRIDRSGGADFDQRVPGPAAPDPVAVARDALENHIENVLFNPRAAEGASFREDVLGWRSPAEKTKYKREILAAARALAPGQDGWEKTESNGKTVFTGRLGGLYTEIEVDPATGKAGRVYVEID